jgi:DNA polymerase II small subunit
MVDPEAAAHIDAQPDPAAYVRRVLTAFLEVPLHLTLAHLRSAEELHAEPAPMPLPAPPTNGYARAVDHDADIEILVDASGDAPPQGDLRDFVRYFNDRYDQLGRLVRRRREVANAVPINRARTAGREVALIGLVEDVSKSQKTGHRFLTLEDQTGSIEVLVQAGRADLVALADTILTDEVIGVVAKTTKDGGLLVADQIVRPDLPLRAQARPPLDVSLHAAFLSDIHIGSRTFLEGPFRRMIRWLHGDTGEARERALAQSIKYLVLPGDVVDGVGVYPGQEESLSIPHVLEQYRQLARELEQVPKHVHIIIQPGNHDASRPTEPQPPFGKEIQSFFDGLNATFVSNPSTFALHGRRVLAYHGFSMIDFATNVPGMSLERPTEIMKQMLQCRHVAPAYGAKTPVAPDVRDKLVIGLEPDVFATGHVHVVGTDMYKDVALINAGTWQAQTDYQKMHNLTPTPAVLPVLNLQTLRMSRVDFSVA